MVDVARVLLYGQHIGAFRWDERRQVALFEYDNRFIGRGIEPSPLMMPVLPGRVYSFGSLNTDTFQGLPGLLADALPDTYGRALFDKWLALTGRSSGNPIESLCFLGKRCMGAMEFEPALEITESGGGLFEVDALVNIARQALHQKAGFHADLSGDKKSAIAAILRLGTSAGGQRAKAIIAYNKETGEVRSGQVAAPAGFAHYLIKLDGVSATTGFRETENYGRLEYSFYQLACACGIEMTDSLLIEENGRAHFLTQRFDRNGNKKVHTQTLCGLAHYDFRLHHAYSYEQAFDVMRRLHLPYSQAREQFRRMVYNVAVRNQDDHTKNISFLMEEDGTWHLSPAYDMGYAYNPQGIWTATHQMSVNGKYDHITRTDLLACAHRNNIRNPEIEIDRICQEVAAWPSLARNCGVPADIIHRITPHLLAGL